MFGPEAAWVRDILRDELRIALFPIHRRLDILMTGQTDLTAAESELAAPVAANGARIGDLVTQLQAAHDADDDAAFEAAATAIRAQVSQLAGQDSVPGSDTTAPAAPTGSDTLSGGQGADSVSGTDTTAG